MKTKIALCCMILSSCLFAQTKVTDAIPKVKFDFKFSVSPIIGVQINVYNKGLNQLNNLLDKNNLPGLFPSLNSFGYGFVLKDDNIQMFFENTFITNVVLNRPVTNKDAFIPILKGFNLCGGGTKKIWERKKWRLDAGFGFSTSRYSFKLVDRRNLESPFDSLLRQPTQSLTSLDYSQKGTNFNIDGRLGLTYNTKWFPKTCYSYDFSFYLNYSQALLRSKNWLVANTAVPVKGMPDINFSNCSFLIVQSIYLKLQKD
jgi:hypothetical protein